MGGSTIWAYCDLFKKGGESTIDQPEQTNAALLEFLS